jgi:hypothetical protein
MHYLLAFLESDGVPTSSMDFCCGGFLFFGIIGFCLVFLYLGWRHGGD